MESLLVELASKENGWVAQQASHDGRSAETEDLEQQKQAIAGFVQSLRALASIIGEQSRHVAKSGSSELEQDSADLADWLFNLCSTIPSFLDPLQLALASLSACRLSSEGEIQAALFEALGESERAIEAMSEIFSRCDGIRNLTEEALMKAASAVDGAGAASGSSASAGGTLLDEEIARAAAAEYGSGLRVDGPYDSRALQAEEVNDAALGLRNDFMSGLLPEGTRTFYDKSYGLPPGTERTRESGYEMVTIPPPRLDPSSLHARIPLAEVMNPNMRKAFGRTQSLNPMQSTVFEAAFHSQENLLICAPTGAGKTNVAMLSVVAHFRNVGIIPSDDLHVSGTSRNNSNAISSANPSALGRKVVYIAPMKALAQEVVEKFSRMLSSLGIVVKELTGDMQLSRAEADRADVIVTTPEKWDVITRKGGDGSLSQSCGLLIIDEVHLLADERGPVIESIVARLQRLVESSQRQTRLVGLSATLPGYEDVATFLRVDKSRGLFYFGDEHRPVPLQQQFVGVTETKDRNKKAKKMNEVCYEIVSDSLSRGHQVMVFVHSRKGTGETARALSETAQVQGDLDRLFITKGKESTSGEAHSKFSPRVAKSRNKELVQHFANGLGIHHAGMLRGDRKLTEEMFSEGAIKVLCCTATLAWGVNLPAHTVVVKGTDVYNPEKGGNVDLSILDVKQIFGRAGRPQFDTSGEASLITTIDALPRYLNKLVRAVPIESSFVKQLPDHLNAEVVGGTVTNIKEAVEWLTYTYLHVRMRKNPLSYGINAERLESDPMLQNRSTELVRDASKLLDEQRMIRYHPESGNLAVTDLGRVASHFYVRVESIAIFNQQLDKKPSPTDADLFHVICCATEFENVKVRPEELPEVDSLKQSDCPLEITAPVEESSGKCCVLMQAYVSNARVTGFTLISDVNYIASNAGRIARALFEMSLKRALGGNAFKLLRIAKSVEKRLWWFQTPLRQFPGELPSQVFDALEQRQGMNAFESAVSLLDMQPREAGELCKFFRGGAQIQSLVRLLPRFAVNCTVHPMSRDILRFHVKLESLFTWSKRWHGSAQGFWVWVENSENSRIYHYEHVVLSWKLYRQPVELEMFIPAFDPLPAQYFLRVVSDTFVGCDTIVPVSFQHLLLPDRSMPYTDLIDLTPLPVTALQNKDFEQLYSKFEFFNPIQTQLFHLLYHTDFPVLLGAPTGSGKTIVAELAILRAKRLNPTSKCVYIAPLKSLARERVKEWQHKLGTPPLDWSVLELSGDTHHDSRTLNRADVLVCTPEKWDLLTRGWRLNMDDRPDDDAISTVKKYIRQVSLVIMDEIHLLGEERGAVLEAIVSRTRYISQFLEQGDASNNSPHRPTRLVGLSTAISNPLDLADWMGINTEGAGVLSKRGLYNFRPSVRPIPMQVHVQGFPGRHYCPRMASMNKPCFAAIKEHSSAQPVIVFVASRRQTRLTAMDLISYAAGDGNPSFFLHCSEDYIESVSASITDESLRHCITFGIGLHHAGLTSSDRETVETLFLGGEIQVIIATATLAWGVNLPAHLVIVKGTEYFDGKTSRYVDYPVTDILQMIGRAGRPQFDSSGIACVFVAESKKDFMKKFLYEPFPVESCVVPRLPDNINAEIASGTIKSMKDSLDYLNWTFLARRVKKNPSYYGAKSDDKEDLEQFNSGLIKDCLDTLKEHDCIEDEVISNPFNTERLVRPTVNGNAASRFYLTYRTPKVMVAGLGRIRRQLKVESDSLTGNAWSPPVGIETETVAKICLLLARCPEFEEVPVRHNEEYLNSELSRLVPWGATVACSEGIGGDGLSSRSEIEIMSDPHTKSFLLIQAHIAGSKLPNSDYITDTRSVLDQLPRLFAALEFLSIGDDSMGVFDQLSFVYRARQTLLTRTLPTANELTQIHGVDDEALKALKQQGISTLSDLRALSRNAMMSKLRKLSERVVSKRYNAKAAIDFVVAIPSVSVARIEVSVLEKNPLKGDNKKPPQTAKAQLLLEFIFDNVAGNDRAHSMSRESSRHNVVLLLGTSKRGFLLAHKVVSLHSGEQPSRGDKKRTISLDFNLNRAASLSEETVTLRVHHEHVRGMDLEFRDIPIRMTDLQHHEEIK